MIYIPTKKETQVFVYIFSYLFYFGPFKIGVLCCSWTKGKSVENKKKKQNCFYSFSLFSLWIPTTYNTAFSPTPYLHSPQATPSNHSSATPTTLLYFFLQNESQPSQKKKKKKTEIEHQRKFIQRNAPYKEKNRKYQQKRNNSKNLMAISAQPSSTSELHHHHRVPTALHQPASATPSRAMVEKPTGPPGDVHNHRSSPTFIPNSNHHQPNHSSKLNLDGSSSSKNSCYRLTEPKTTVHPHHQPIQRLPCWPQELRQVVVATTWSCSRPCTGRSY